MMSRRRFQDILPSTPCSRCRRLDSTIRAVLLPGYFLSHLGFTSAGVAPLSPRFRKLLDETVKTFAVFPSCLQLLDCDDNCMLSDPLSTSDLHYSRWQSGEICQVLSTGAFTLFCHVFMVSRKIYAHPLSLLCYCLAHAFVCSMCPVFSA